MDSEKQKLRFTKFDPSVPCTDREGPVQFLLVLFMLINVMTLDSCLFWSFMFVVDVTEK